MVLQALAALQAQLPVVSDERARQAEAADPRFRTNGTVLRVEQLDGEQIGCVDCIMAMPLFR